jgi:hypothetical protein
MKTIKNMKENGTNVAESLLGKKKKNIVGTILEVGRLHVKEGENFSSFSFGMTQAQVLNWRKKKKKKKKKIML